jgi:U3 small nucleolar RNA-associated protein 13
MSCELTHFLSIWQQDINIISIAPNDSLIAMGLQDKTVELWRSTDLSLKATLKGYRRGIWDFASFLLSTKY